jgi:hypothetical protein
MKINKVLKEKNVHKSFGIHGIHDTYGIHYTWTVEYKDDPLGGGLELYNEDDDGLTEVYAMSNVLVMEFYEII